MVLSLMRALFFSLLPAAKLIWSHAATFLIAKRAGIPVPHDYDSLSRIVDHPVGWLITRPLLWAVMGVILGPYGFFLGWRALKIKRLIRNIPRSTIRAAALGPVEIVGKASGPYTLVSPIANNECLYYRLVVLVGERGARKIVDEMCAPVFIDDGTGKVMMDPRGAGLEMDPYEGTHSDYLGHVAARHGFSKGDVVSAQEFCIRSDDTIFVLGTLRENPWADNNADVHATALSRIGPGFVSEAEADIQRRSVYEFLDPSAPSGCVQVSAAEFDLHPPVILMKGSPFIISNRSQREVISDLSWKSIVYIWGGPIATLLGVWGILKHLQWWGVLP
jgi:hypothetical protein